MKSSNAAPAATSPQLGMPLIICCSHHDVVSVVAAATVLGSGIVPADGVTTVVGFAFVLGTCAGKVVTPVATGDDPEDGFEPEGAGNCPTITIGSGIGVRGCSGNWPPITIGSAMGLGG